VSAGRRLDVLAGGGAGKQESHLSRSVCLVADG